MTVLNKYYNIKNLNFIADKNKIYLFDVKLNKSFEVEDFEKLQIKTFLDEIKNNDFLVEKSQKVMFFAKNRFFENLMNFLGVGILRDRRAESTY